MTSNQLSLGALIVTVLLAALPASPQQSAVAVNSPIPGLVNFTGGLKSADGKPAGGVVGVTFALYRDEEGGSPLWLETQNVTLDASGHYSVMLGANTRGGLPMELFTSKEARWLSVEPQGLPSQARVLLLSVPYALKAGDAETIGGLPPTAFVRAAVPTSNGSAEASSSGSVPPPSSPVTTSGGTSGTLPLWDGASDIGNSAVVQTGSGSTAKVGIGTSAPGATLDVKGSVIARGTVQLPSKGTASASKGFSSQPLSLQASSFNSGTQTAITPNFQWQAEPAGNNTANPSGTLNLLFSTTANPAETGLNISSNGQIRFASGQTFPGTGTITQVNAGPGLTGGGNSGSVTLGVDTGKVPQLNTANTFTGNQSITGKLTATGAVTGSTVNATTGFAMGGVLFAFGNSAKANALLGFAGNSTMTGSSNTAVGDGALSSNTSGGTNTAVGDGALNRNTTGSGNNAIGLSALLRNTSGQNNVADGEEALFSNTSGSGNVGVGALTLFFNTLGNGNTAVGDNALPTTDGGTGETAVGAGAGGTLSFENEFGTNNTFLGAGTTPGTQLDLTNATAVGAFAEVDASNSMVLGSINRVNSATADTNVGIGITTPQALLHIDHQPPAGVGQDVLLITSGGTGDVASLMVQNTAPGLRLRVGAGTDSSYLASSGPLEFVTGDTGNPDHPADPVMFIDGLGHVGIQETAPGRALQVGQGSGHAIADGWDTYSSRRWKTNIHTLDSALTKVESLRGVSYDLKASGKHEIGVIAEEVGQVVPEVVTYEANGKDAQGVDYSRLTALLIEAVKQQQQQIRQQRKQIRLQHSEIAKLRTQDAALAVRLAKVEKRGQDSMSSHLALYRSSDVGSGTGTRDSR